MPLIRVYTYYHPEVIGGVLCYTRYGTADAVIYDIEAPNGIEAKKIAKKLRQQREGWKPKRGRT
jgi:hypothetical protein